MPIRESRKALYPKDWAAISRRIKTDRAQGRCEFDAYGLLPGTGANGRCTAEHGKPHPVTGSKVVLTTAHLDHDERNCADENLLAGCQLCHNRYDAPFRLAGRKERLSQFKGKVRQVAFTDKRTTLGTKRRTTGQEPAAKPNHGTMYLGRLAASMDRSSKKGRP